MDEPLFALSVILVNYNTAALLPECLDRVEAASKGLSVQLIVVDNASRDSSSEVLRGYSDRCEVIKNPVNVGFGRANNQVLDRVRGRYVLLLNVDAFIEADALVKTLAYMEAHPRCGILGVRLIGRDGDLQPSCRYFPTPWNVFLNQIGLARLFPRTRLVDDMQWSHDAVRACDWVPGCFYLVRPQLIAEIGLFDPRFFVYYEEVDHCRRARTAGWEVIYFPDTAVVHLGGEAAKSAGQLGAGQQLSELQIESELLYFRKHHGLAGVLLSLLLTALCDAVLAVKAALRVRPLAALKANWRGLWQHSFATATTFVRTGGARRATR
jgi:GT2 family glycosyltransferase